MLPEFAIIGVASACCNPYTRCAQSVGLAIFVLNTVCPYLGCVNDMRFFKKVVRKISLNRLIHRKNIGFNQKLAVKSVDFSKNSLGKCARAQNGQD